MFLLHSDFQSSLSPNDDGRFYDTPHNDGNDHSCSSNADECEDDFATSMGETSTSEGNVHINSESPAQGNLPHNISQGQHDLRRSSRVLKMPAKFNDYVVNSSKKYGLEKYVTYTNLNTSIYYFSTNLNKSSELTSYFEAVKNPNWIKAMNNEIEALNRNNTWTVCELPVGRKAVGSKWLWKIKYKSTSEIERYKARVVAKGFSQREGFNYLETFSPVVKMSTVRCMLNVAICNGWDLFQLNINNAFLYGGLSKDVYMTIPPGFDTNKSKVCKLNKSLYGLKQAPRQWNAKLTQALTEHVFVQSKFDYSLFTKNSDNVFIILLVYVDDIVVTGNNLNEIEKFMQFLKSNQRKYCLELLHEFGLLAAKHVDTPLPENATWNHTESDDDHLLVNLSNYQRLVGKLIYLTNTRPDISYVIHCLSQYMHSNLNSHLDDALRVLRYLNGSPGSGIQINKTGNLKLRAYADSDRAMCPATRKSVFGYCIFLGDSLVTWKSKRQSTLSRCSVEAEYRSMAFATGEVIWLSNLLGDMGVKNLLPVVMYYDNSSALHIAANPVFHEKSKHFEINVHLVREKVASGVINTKKIHTTQQIVDILTKGDRSCISAALLLCNPLHFQTSDFNSNTIISVKLTGTENYKVWAAAIKSDINTRNKTGFLDGTCLKSIYANSAPLSNQSSLLARETLPDVKDAFSINSREESHRGIASSSSGYVTKPLVSSFVAKSNSWNNIGNKKFDNNKRVGNSTNNTGPNPNLNCTNCGKVGHTVDRCFDIIGYPPGYNKNSGTKPNGPRTFNANSVSSSSMKGASLSFTNE
ncbi:ribonuclease H-like domain-containing protein [Tanacetum coccineum]